jgi:VIT1/CCC1 family predicted Fe2+/Mn2+ transporter
LAPIGTVPGAESWFHERQSAWLYRRLAAAEHDATKRELFESLAVAAERQALRWEQEASMTPAQIAAFQPSLRAKIVAQLLSLLGPRPLRAVLTAMKLRGLSVYGSALAVPGHPMPTSLDEVGARHRGTGSNLRAAVFGVSDGLVSNASLILGVGGAGVPIETLLMSGVAGMFAGALSMAAGEYVSVRSQREMYEYQIALEKEELDEYPEEEAEELALIYHARGMPLDKAREVSTEMMRNPEHALDVLAREELGLNPASLGSPWGAAASSFFAFAGGAFIPLVPILAGVLPARVLPLTAALTLIALFVIGTVLSLFTGRSALRGGLRMVLIGAAAGAISYAIGHVLGAAVS